ncbi:MAG: deoxyguanosinetriphosphate triphosphohydrolase [Prevotellaceae bacterium]|jgi:dGTPase|nr:deoxyguanosinetriphosphate triphosphohydrolase [Prevotellaceae bacterium]
MNWNQLLSTKRLGLEELHESKEDERTEFQRDYDRLIFSAPFRRLQNKTQVFPLPGSIFVHNRLTHSLEVACVGRSLGVKVSQLLSKKYAKALSPYMNEIGSIVSAACLAHDMGNPPFGHSGEKAIATHFSEGVGSSLKNFVGDEEWTDFIHFEGNANAFRLLTHQFRGKRPGGFVLTYSTLASVVKYPYASLFADDKKQKFGFFHSEKTTFERISRELGIEHASQCPNRYARYPLVYLVEAADDICYQLMDIEDAHKLRLIDKNETLNLFLGFFNKEQQKRRLEIMEKVDDPNEKIAYLRSSVVGLLVNRCAQIFVANEENILSGTFEGSLIKHLSGFSLSAYNQCEKVAIEKIYNSSEVLDVELSGYKIILTLLEHFLSAVIEPQKAYSQQLLMRVPKQYDISNGTYYNKIMAVLDYISGMTDVYALDMYRKITGINIPSL